MRFLYLFLIGLSLISCNKNLDSAFDIEKIPVFDVEVPADLHVNVDYTLSFKYALPNGCYSFHDYTYEIVSDNERIITAYAKVDNSGICTMEYTEETFYFTFTPTERKTYILHFWIGNDEEGNDEYKTYELPVE